MYHLRIRSLVFVYDILSSNVVEEVESKKVLVFFFFFFLFFKLTQSQWGSNEWCSCGNRLLGQTRGRTAAPCFRFLVYKCLCGQCKVVLKRSLKTRNRSRRVCPRWMIAAEI